MSSARRGSGSTGFTDGGSGAAEDVWTKLVRQVYEADTNKKRKEKASKEGNEDPVQEEPGVNANGQEGASGPAAPTAAVESYALCVGMPGAGKSSLLSLYLNPNKEETPKPTVALDYLFARKSAAANAPKDIAHIYELGGGSHVSDLVRVPITPANFQSAMYLIVLDLSKPSNVLPQVLHWTEHIKASVKLCVRETTKADPTFADSLKKRTYAKFGKDHPDLRLVKPCPVPLLLVANKYDQYKDREGAKRKVLGQALRFVAHVNGASLLMCSTKEKQLKDVFRLMLNKHLFRTAGKRVMETNAEKALIVPAGADSFEAILKSTPAGTHYADFVTATSVADGAMDLWKRSVEDVFGPPAPDDVLDARPEEGQEAEARPHPEACVDEMRAQRDEALRRYQRESERRAKLERKEAPAPKSSSTAPTTDSPSASRSSRKPGASESSSKSRSTREGTRK